MEATIKKDEQRDLEEMNTAIKKDVQGEFAEIAAHKKGRFCTAPEFARVVGLMIEQQANNETSPNRS